VNLLNVRSQTVIFGNATMTFHCEKCSVAKYRSLKNVAIFLQLAKKLVYL